MIKLSTRIEDSIGIHCFTVAERARERESFANLPAERRDLALSEARKVFKLVKKYIEKAENDVHSFLNAPPNDISDVIYGDAQEAYGLLGSGVILACRSGIDFDNYPKDVQGLGVTYDEILRLSLESMQLHINGVLAAIDGNNFEPCIRELHQWGLRYERFTGITTNTFYQAINRTKDDVDAQMLAQVFQRTPDKAVTASDELCSTLSISPAAKRRAFQKLSPAQKTSVWHEFDSKRGWIQKAFRRADRFNIDYKITVQKGAGPDYGRHEHHIFNIC